MPSSSSLSSSLSCSHSSSASPSSSSSPRPSSGRSSPNWPGPSTSPFRSASLCSLSLRVPMPVSCIRRTSRSTTLSEYRNKDDSNRVFSHTEKGLFPVPIPQAWLRHVHRVWGIRLAAPIRRHNNADRAVDPLIVTVASTTTFPFHKYNSQAWEMVTGNKPFSVCENTLMGWG
ncbi:hypothetical protein FPQ18DRAFT_93434 [Pyronema domesticum]|nr:hypothetical protein FPQ18DRAFT_93434 [Pyronema domesticum]